MRTPDSPGTVAFAPTACSDATRGSSDEPPVPRQRTADVEATTVRNTDGNPRFLAEDGGTNRDDGGRSARVGAVHHSTGEFGPGRLRVPDGAADPGALVTATGPGSEPVCPIRRRTGECYVPRLDGVFRDGDADGSPTSWFPTTGSNAVPPRPRILIGVSPNNNLL
jgi:hypothetical protein